MYKQHYQQFIKQHAGQLHCAPHSHHYWPDVTRAAQLAYWDDSANGADHKWDKMFGEVVPEVQQRLATLLRLSNPNQLVFAPNTHELLYRVLSCFAPDQPLRILTTDSEFHSFSRQVKRLRERAQVQVEIVPTQPYESFAARWQQALTTASYDVIFISQVFYNSGVIAPWVGDWLAQVPTDTVVMIDGYHGIGAIDTDLSQVEDRIFYLGGSYKYLQAGEGCCFMSVPRQCQLRPEYTGWFADFANLAKPQQAVVEYANDGYRFAGATMDLSALYRLRAVLAWWAQEPLAVTTIHHYVQSLQQAFLAHLDSLEHEYVNRAHLLVDPNATDHGHFFTFQLPSATLVNEIAAQLSAQGVHTDYRNDRLRFGFALYHDAADYQQIQLAR